MEIKTLAELTEPDDMVLHFTPWGLATGLALKPEASAEFLQRIVADCDLISVVPDEVRVHFERSRKLHTRGLFDHEFFVIAMFQAILTLELALSLRFLQHFGNQIPLTNTKTGAKMDVQVGNYRELYDHLHGAYAPKKSWRVVGCHDFSGNLNSLLAWAKAEGLYSWQFNQHWETAVVWLRNNYAHARSVDTLMHNDSAQMIREIAIFVNHLWDPAPRWFQDEIAQIPQTVAAAWGLLHQGQPAAGLARLDESRRRAATLPDDHEPWRGKLVNHYRNAFEEYDCFARLAIPADRLMAPNVAP